MDVYWIFYVVFGVCVISLLIVFAYELSNPFDADIVDEIVPVKDDVSFDHTLTEYEPDHRLMTKIYSFIDQTKNIDIKYIVSIMIAVGLCFFFAHRLILPRLYYRIYQIENKDLVPSSTLWSPIANVIWVARVVLWGMYFPLHLLATIIMIILLFFKEVLFLMIDLHLPNYPTEFKKIDPTTQLFPFYPAAMTIDSMRILNGFKLFVLLFNYLVCSFPSIKDKKFPVFGFAVKFFNGLVNIIALGLWYDAIFSTETYLNDLQYFVLLNIFRVSWVTIFNFSLLTCTYDVVLSQKIVSNLKNLFVSFSSTYIFVIVMMHTKWRGVFPSLLFSLFVLYLLLRYAPSYLYDR